MRYRVLFIAALFLFVASAAEAQAVPNAGVKVITVVNNDNGPTPKAPSDFQFTIAESGQVPLFSFAGSEKLTLPLTVSAATTFLFARIAAPANYATAFSGDCNPDGTIVVRPNELKSCTMTHTYVTASESGPIRSVLKVIKQINANSIFGQLAQPSDFTLRVSNNTSQFASFPGSPAGSNVGLTANPGGPIAAQYFVSEIPNGPFSNNYIPTFSGDCDRTGKVLIQHGLSTCVVTNTRANESENGARTAILKIIKVVEFNEEQFGSTPQPEDFAIEVLRSGSPVATVTGSALGMNVGLAAGNASATSYTVRELVTNVSNSFFPIYSGDCSATGEVSLQAGQLKTCVVTNAFMSDGESSSPTALLKVIKRMDGNRPFGTPTQPEEFTIEVLPGQVDPGDSPPSPAATVRGSVLGLSVGLNPSFPHPLYTVRERPFNSQFLPTYSGDCNTNGVVNLPAGQIKTCVVTNSFLEGAENGSTAVLKITKLVDPTGDSILNSRVSLKSVSTSRQVSAPQIS